MTPSLTERFVQTWTSLNRWIAVAAILPWVLMGFHTWQSRILATPLYFGVLILFDLIHFLIVIPFIRWFWSTPTPKFW